MSKIRGKRPLTSSYEERVASMRNGGGALGAMSGEPRQRTMPPLPPDMAPLPQSHTAPGVPAAPKGGAPRAPVSEPPACTHIEFSRFTEADKQNFFAMLDDVRTTGCSPQYFGRRTGGSDMW